MTADDPTWRLPSSLRALRPEATHALDRVNARAWQVVDPRTLDLVRLAAAGILGNEAGSRRRSAQAHDDGLTDAVISRLDYYPSAPEFSDAERARLAFAEQFVMDVSSLDADDLARLSVHVPEDRLRGFVTAVYVTEFTQRLEMMAGLLLGVGDHDFPPAPPSSDLVSPTDPAELRAELGAYQAIVVQGTSLDPAVTELVRLRCARTHDCRICQTLRLADAREVGVDDTMTAKIDFYESSDLPERSKVALRITDAFITRPDTLSPSSIDQARRTFSPDELAELCLDITKWSTQKIHVALGTDGADALPTNDDGVSFLTFNSDGTVAGYSATAAHSV